MVGAKKFTNLQNKSSSGLPDPRIGNIDLDVARGIGKRMPLGNSKVSVSSLPNGQLIENLGKRSALDVSTGGSFYSKFYSIVDGARHLFLRGGMLYGYDYIPDIDLTVQFDGLDSTHHLWLEITGDCNEVDGFIIGGFSITSAVIGSGENVPDDDSVSVGDSSGKKMYYYLGTAVGSLVPLTLNFSPANVGDLQVSYCPTSFTRNRA